MVRVISLTGIFDKGKRLQSAIEMLSVYSWALILIAMVIVLVFVLSGPFAPARYLGSSCNIQPLMRCANTYLAPYTKSGDPIKFTLIFYNNLGVTLNFTKSAFNITTSNLGQKGTLNSSGACLPSIAHAGAEVICTADIYGSVEPPLYSSVSDSFKIGYYICKGGSCSGPYVSTGTSIQELSPGAISLVNLSIFTTPSSGIVVINGIRYSNAVSVPLESGNYTLYAIAPKGYAFNKWIFNTQNSSISNATSTEVVLRLTSPSAITANFTKT